MSIFHLKYVQICQGESGGSAVDRYKDHGSLPYMDPMWGRNGPSMDPYKDLIWMLMLGSSGPVTGGHGSVETENGAIA